MVLKTIQWNIGGAHNAEGVDVLPRVIDVIRRCGADIVTLQETHADGITVQAEEVARALGFSSVRNDVYDASHLASGQRLGQAIISRFPFRSHAFEFFVNPGFEAVGPDGRTWRSHDKGVSRCAVELKGGRAVEVATLHLIPFHHFGVDPLDQKFEGLRKNIAELASPRLPTFLLQGDFNVDYDLVGRLLPDLMAQGMSEAESGGPTTPKGKRPDRILFRGMRHIRSEVIDDVPTDHFPVYSEFEV